MGGSDVRSMLMDEIRRDIVGPRGGEEETLPKRENPARTYLSGILFPKETPLDEESTHRMSQADDGDEDADPTDEQYGHNVGVRPASFGITCTVSRDIDRVLARVDYGTYSLEEGERGREVFRRTPRSQTFSIPLGRSRRGKEAFEADPDICLRYSVRTNPDTYTLSIFVVNDHSHREVSDVRDHVFQPCITLTPPEGAGGAFLDSRPSEPYSPDSDLFEMLFRDKRGYAIGHGCAVEWDGENAGAVSRIRTTFTPAHYVHSIGPRRMGADGLSMERLYRVTDFSEYRALLSPIADEYERWISARLESRIESLPPRFWPAAKRQVDECRTALGRIRRGMEIVSTDHTAGEAFAFANRAMLLQQSHGEWARSNMEEGRCRGSEPDRYFGEWRAFQLAFILLNIESISDPKSEDRKTADLLWFATAGGKTEAYLGLVAFTIAHRRLRNSVDHRRYGTTVLIRYTLRLLTLQQLHRIARLMCACEFIRRRDPERWGDEPFLVGLWVGSKTTPNSLRGEFGAERAIQQARGGGAPREHNPVQLVSCVWCGAKIDAHNYYVEGRIKQCRIYCSNRYCEFSRRTGDEETNLPVLVVDEDIYRRCPALVIGTVDKFARMAWRWETRAIFGRVNKYCQKHGFVTAELADECGNHQDYDSFHFADVGPSSLEPPELIIQDELHLISGPLGTLTGLYETAVDLLCTNDDGIPPKIIASTATAKRASEQIRNLFNRDISRVFPPQGFEFGESFFSEVVTADSSPDKAYLGITTPMNSMQVLGRVSAAVLGRVRSEDAAPDELDPYYTLVAYFNRIKEMGTASHMYNENVPAHIRRIRGQHGEPDESNRIVPLDIKELTSRMDSSEIPQILRNLETRLGGEVKPVDVLLCTNMLSVGVDISRLGVMVINGQPKSHSEYIQASGRIGRNSPGLVVVNYNYLRPRDLSHYESFNYYHSTLHKNVEPVSLTPFSPRARDKALFGVLVALARLLEERLAKNSDAERLDSGVDYVRRVMARIQDSVSRRVAAVDMAESEGTLKDLEGMVAEWERWAANPGLPRLYAKPYGRAASENALYLMKSLESPSPGLRPVPNSLRDAEGMVRLRYMQDIQLREER